MIDRLNKEYDVPPRCSIHEVVKGEARGLIDHNKWCPFCSHYHLNLTSKTCYECLKTDDLDNFKPIPEWYEYGYGKKEEK